MKTISPEGNSSDLPSVSEDWEPGVPTEQEILDAVARLQRAAAMGSGASKGAQKILNFCFRGNNRDTIALIDLCRLDGDNRRAAGLLINLVAAIGHTLPTR